MRTVGDKIHSHDSNCIHSIANLIETLSSSLCQTLIKSSWLYSGSKVGSLTKTFKKRIKNLEIKILANVLSFVDNGLLISQEKSYLLSFSFLLCSYNIMSKILLDIGFIMEHNKTKLFYFARVWHLFNPSIDLSSIGGPIISPKSIWQCYAVREFSAEK